MAVYFELPHRLRTNPERMKDPKDAAPEEARQARGALRGLAAGRPASGPTMSTREVIQFVNVVANGMALATVASG